ncbi:hypothetical protein [Vibrio mediterranei]|uniref:hypothetical protein n=1 Tax=Vibrio mediterranei TaxID=689 RepID=UPI004067E66C
MKYFLLSLPLSLTAISHASDLCQDGEKVVSGCELRNGNTVSFCADGGGITTYRYGISITLNWKFPSVNRGQCKR